MPNTPFPATAEGMPNFTNTNHVSLFMEITPAMRQRIEQTVDHLIWLLDTLEGDPDLEDDGTAEDVGDDEPWLSAGLDDFHQRFWPHTLELDFEVEVGSNSGSLDT